MVSALTYAGFHVVSFASNHTLDWGVDALLDTIDVLKQNGLAVIGVGKDIEEARKPLILERKGVKVAFLAYCSVHRPGYEATADKPGLVPMRAWSIYQPLEHQPGTPGVRIRTFPDPGDLEAMEEDIRRARTLADVVVVSMHWGIHFERATIAMYQRRVGHAAINAGADLIIGHHAHILKGMEVYKGKVIVYSMCNFAMATTYERALHRRENIPGWREMHKAYDWELDPDYSGYAWPYDSRKSIVVKALIEDKKVARVSFLRGCDPWKYLNLPGDVIETIKKGVLDPLSVVQTARRDNPDIEVKGWLKIWEGCHYGGNTSTGEIYRGYQL